VGERGLLPVQKHRVLYREEKTQQTKQTAVATVTQRCTGHVIAKKIAIFSQ